MSESGNNTHNVILDTTKWGGGENSSDFCYPALLQCGTLSSKMYEIFGGTKHRDREFRTYFCR
ncbi:hypothetical protein FACS1894111_05210 [Clostridia bacterium]|nr:hypothetical protein FACS1894111_05210 [Clostridia bacterium]